MKAIGYVRVSTEEQALTGVSLDAQEEKIIAYCIAKEWALTRVISDAGYSAKDLNRPGMQEIISGCKRKEFDVVVILKLDRLTRSVKDLGHLVEDVFKKNDVAFSSLQDNFDTATANGRMVMNILATLAQWERDIISERTRDAMQFMKKERKRVGAVPFGYDCNNGSLSPNPEEAVVVDKMMALRKKGRSYQKIAAHLNSKSISAKNGGKWHPKVVMGVLKNSQSYFSDYSGDI